MDSRLSRAVDRISSVGRLPLGTVGTVLLFLFAVQLLGAATDAASPLLRRLFFRVVVGDAAALGLSWLAAYALGNGSVVAALALSLFTADIVSVPQLFLLVAGSRLGAAAIVVFVGALDFFQKKRYTLQESVSLGLLAFLLTLSIYLPVTALGYVALPWLREPLQALTQNWSLGVRSLSVLEPLTAAITARAGPALTFALAVALLFGSLTLFDRLLGTVDTETLRERFFSRLQRTWVSFAVGLLVTGLTTSVAFSLGVVVPLYNRDYVTREELVPYVLGANIGTLFDTVLVAVVLESAVGVAVVLELLVVATGLTLAALFALGTYSRGIFTAYDRLLDDRRLFVAFALVLLAVPLALVLVPLVTG